MFYSQLILAKKGPLGTIWIAAHLERKLRKNQVTETNISVSVDSILFPEAPIALRLSGHLLLGVVRIYSRKVNYLFHDCSEALTKIKQAFHSGVVDLPPEAATAPFHAITLPENFDLDELEPLPDREIALLLSNGAVDHHVTTREQITLQDPLEDNIYFGSQFSLDERFADGDASRMSIDFDEDLLEKPESRAPSPAAITLEEDVLPPMGEDKTIDYDRMDQMAGLDMEEPHLEEPHLEPMTPAPPLEQMEVDEADVVPEAKQPEEPDQLEPLTEVPITEALPLSEPCTDVVEQVEQPKEPDQMEPITGVPEQVEPCADLVEQLEALVEVPDEVVTTVGAADQPKPLMPVPPFEFDQDEVPEYEKVRSAVEPPAGQEPDVFALEKEAVMADEDVGKDVQARVEEAKEGEDHLMEDKEQMVEEKEQIMEEMQHETISPLVLTSPPKAPTMEDDLPADDDVLATLLGGRVTPAIRVMPTPTEEGPPQKKRRGPKPIPRKRKAVIDSVMVLHGDVMREQLANTADIRRVRKKAPCTRHELWMVQKQSLGYQIFGEPSVPGLCMELRELYERVLVKGEADLPAAAPVHDITPENEAVPQTPRPEEELLVEEQQTQGVQPEAQEVSNEQAAIASIVPDTGNADANATASPSRPVQEAEEQQHLHTKEGQELNHQDLATETTEDVKEDVDAAEKKLGKEVAVDSEEQVAAEFSEEVPVVVGTVAEEAMMSKENEVEGTELEPLAALSPVQTPAEIEVPLEADAVTVGAVATDMDELPPIHEELPTGGPEVLTEVQGDMATVVKDDEVDEVTAIEPDAEVEELVPGEGTTAAVMKDEEAVLPAGGEQPTNEGLGFLEESHTVFLAQDDDDLYEEAEEYLDGTEYAPKESMVQGFSGWSARTRAVGRYLQGTFETMEADARREEKDDQPKLGLDHMLRGKSKREAARMFFETLVLKTKDYIHVEQEQPFSEIDLSARPKLLKASF